MSSESVAPAYEFVALDSLEPHPSNPRRGDVELIAESIDRNGFYGAVLVQRSTRRIVAGEHRWRGVRLLRERGVTVTHPVESNGSGDPLPRKPLPADTVPVLWLDVGSEEATRIMLADNATADSATYDDRALADLLKSVDDLTGTGFAQDDVAELLARMDPPAEPESLDEVPAAPKVAISKPGDLWRLGPHRLLCGDCRDAETVGRLLSEVKVAVAVTSPPYADRRPYDKLSPFRPIAPEKYVEWFEPVQANVADHLAGDGSWFVNLKAGAEDLDTHLYVFDLVLAHVREWGWHFATEFCWERAGLPQRPARRFKNQYEPIYQFARGDWKFRPKAVRAASDSVPRYVVGDNYVGERRQGDGSDAMSHRSEAGLAFPGNRLPTFTGSHEATGHSAAFPVGLAAFFLRAYSDPGEAVFDPFMGSGSTILAAHQEGRVGYGVEISPEYVDIACKRYQRVTGEAPVYGATGEAIDFDL